jgi:hypothetical protein
MIKMIGLSLFLMLCFTACTPRVGVGIGGVVASGDGIAASEVHADSETGVHGSITMGTDIRL